jgi:hypothetical protein
MLTRLQNVTIHDPVTLPRAQDLWNALRLHQSVKSVVDLSGKLVAGIDPLDKRLLPAINLRHQTERHDR